MNDSANTSEPVQHYSLYIFDPLNKKKIYNLIIRFWGKFLSPKIRLYTKICGK